MRGNGARVPDGLAASDAPEEGCKVVASLLHLEVDARGVYGGLNFGARANNAGIIEQTRLLMSLQLASPVSWPLLDVVVSWAVLLFCGFGILSRLNATSVAAVLVGAFAVASAIFLILELNEPFSGVFRIPGASVEQTIKAIGI